MKKQGMNRVQHKRLQNKRPLRILQANDNYFLRKIKRQTNFFILLPLKDVTIQC